MYRLFEDQPFKGKTISSKFEQAKRKYQGTLDKAMRYYRENLTFIDNSHILVKLLDSLSLDLEQSDDLTYRLLQAKSDEIAAGHGITTIRNVGEIHEDVFYTKDCVVIMVEFDNVIALDNWKNLAPVRPLTFQHHDLTPALPTEIYTDYDTDYAVVGIDIPLLGLQYKGWKKENARKEAFEREGTKQFVSRYVLPQMLPYQADIVIRNLYLAKATGEVRSDIMPDLPFTVLTYENEFAEGVETLLKDLSLKTPSFSEVTEMLPAIYLDNYANAAPIVFRTLSIYSYWATFLIYLDWVYPIIKSVPTLDVNQELIPKKMRSVKRYANAARPFKKIEKTKFKSKVEDRWNFLLDVTK